MKLFIRNLIIFLLIQLLLWGGVVWVYVRHRPFEKEYMAAGLDKERLLAEQTSPRIVMIGGSNVAFGFDSAEINRRLAYNPVNMGLHVNLGVDYMLAEVEQSLRPGDVVVVSFEYELFGALYYGNAAELFLALEQRPENIRFLSLGSKQLMLNQGYNLLGEILDASINYFLGHPDSSESNDTAYKRSAFNQYGDIVLHRGAASKKIVSQSLLNYKITHDSILRTVNRLNRFGEMCHQKGVQVVYLYPPTTEQYFKQAEDKIHEIAATLSQELKFQIINTPEEITLPVENFFDTVYHLNVSGIKKRTDQLIEKLAGRIDALK